MSKLIDKIEQDFLGAVKQKNAPLLLVLRSLKNALHNLEIERRGGRLAFTALDEEDIYQVIAREIKQRQDSIVEFKKGERADLIEKEENEIKILSAYLLPQVKEKRLNQLIDEAISQTNASVKDAGKVMGVLMPKLKGRVDGSKLIKKVIDRLDAKRPLKS